MSSALYSSVIYNVRAPYNAIYTYGHYTRHSSRAVCCARSPPQNRSACGSRSRMVGAKACVLLLSSLLASTAGQTQTAAPGHGYFATSLSGLGGRPIGETPTSSTAASVLMQQSLEDTDPLAVCNDGTRTSRPRTPCVSRPRPPLPPSPCVAGRLQAPGLLFLSAAAAPPGLARPKKRLGEARRRGVRSRTAPHAPRLRLARLVLLPTRHCRGSVSVAGVPGRLCVTPPHLHGSAALRQRTTHVLTRCRSHVLLERGELPRAQPDASLVHVLDPVVGQFRPRGHI